MGGGLTTHAAALRPVAYVPAAHVVQALLPTTLANVPAAHCEQTLKAPSAQAAHALVQITMYR